MVRERDTVVALITSALSPVRMALRASGEGVPQLWQELLAEPWPADYGAFEKCLLFASLAIPCKVFCMPKGRSYTRENVLEIHFPANKELSGLLLERIFSMGVRPAEPGEFTRRAFLNGRIQLNQAQSVAALIAATDQKQRQEAVQMMSSGQGDLLKALKECIFIFRRNLEAVIDFPEEPDVEKNDWRWLEDLGALEEQLERWQLQDSRQLDSGSALKILLLGPANSGKSSLVRALVPGSMPVVSHVPGTTLDLVPYSLEGDVERVQLYDSPGLKEIENLWDKLSLGRLHERLESFDGYLLLQSVDDTRAIDWPVLPKGAKILRIASKADISLDNNSGDNINKNIKTGNIKNININNNINAENIKKNINISKITQNQVNANNPIFSSQPRGSDSLKISALTGEGIAELKDILAQWTKELAHCKTSPFAALRQRLVTLTRQRLVVCRTLLLSKFPNEELAAYELDELLDEIDGLTGQEGGSEALLDGIFRDFCIGK